MIMATAKTQRARILRLLTDAHGDWVPLPRIMACAAQYNARLFELRRSGFVIENRTETDRTTGERRSWFRLVESRESTSDSAIETEFMGRRRREDDRAMPLFAGVRQ
jgi:hypothetical protein